MEFTGDINNIIIKKGHQAKLRVSVHNKDDVVIEKIDLTVNKKGKIIVK